MAVEKIGNYNIHQNPATNENQFDVENYLNENWNKTKEVVNNNADELISVQGRVSALETDNTTNKQDISEIKEEQIEQNTNIESLQTKLEKVEKEFNDYAIHGQASGEFIHLTDSAKSSCKIDIKGNVKQETRSGKNLWNDTSIENKKVSELTNTQISMSDLKLEAGDYRFKLFFTDGTYAQADVNVLLKNSENATLKIISINSYATLTEEEAEQIVSGVCFTNATGLANYANKTITGLMLTKGTTAVDKYEQYGASPSLDYPSPIQTVKDSVKVTSCSANVLDLTTLTAVNTIECTTENKKENEITLTSTNKTGASYIRFKGKIKAGTWYVKKEFEVLSGTGTNYTGRVFIQDTNWNNVLVLNKNLKEGSFTLEEDKELYITLIAKETTDTSTEVIKIRFYNLMISKDDVDFVKHEQNSITVSIQQEMLTNDYLDKTNKKEIHNFRKIILDGTQNYTLLTTTENYLRFMLDLNKTSDLKNGFKVYCENLKVVKQTTSNSVNEEKIIERDISLDKQLQIVILKSRLAEPTVEGLKQYLATNNIVAYCELEEPTKLDLTQEQIEVLEKLDEMQTYKNITNITTDSIAILDVDYKKDLETWQKQQDDRITALEELLNTTQTSAMLIENLENDLLKEVE